MTEAKKKNINAPFTTTLRTRFFLLLLLNSVYLTIFIRFFPNKLGGLGHDYAYWFPRLIAGAYWHMQNGWLSVPWFTPALNGGNLLYSDPESIYFSFPQLVTFFVDPLTAITITFVVFSIIGTLGFYTFLRKIFWCSFWTSFLGAALFLFNGFFTYRMVVGHLPYHAYMLLPWILICILWQDDRVTIYYQIIRGAAAALLLSYCFYSGGIHFLVPMTLSIVAVGLTYSHVFVKRHSGFIWLRFGLCLTITGMLCASKLIAALSVIKNIPRTAYRLPGIPDLLDLVLVPFQSLFFTSISGEKATQVFTNMQWALDRHEFEYCISFIPLLVITAGICFRIIRFNKKRHYELWRKKQWLCFIGIFIILLIPLLANFYTPQWNAILKSIPVIKSSSTLVRWYAMYIPIGILLSVLVFEKFQVKPVIKSLLAGVCILVIIALNLIQDKTFCYVNSYDYRPISQGFLAVKGRGRIPAIEYVGLTTTVDTPQNRITYNNDAQINIGVSDLQTRFSLFGYKLEFFPQRDKLKIGRVDQITEGHFNMKNPSCYIFPGENQCKSGDHFRFDQIEQLNNFTHYRPYKFRMPAIQRIANWVSLITALICLTLLLFRLIYYLAAKFSNPNSGYKKRWQCI